MYLWMNIALLIIPSDLLSILSINTISLFLYIDMIPIDLRSWPPPEMSLVNINIKAPGLISFSLYQVRLVKFTITIQPETDQLKELVLSNKSDWL